MPKVSVIIPIYKAETTIERCAVQLMEQTLDDIEYIFIDDCTPDASIQILEDVIERYPSRKPQVRMVKMSVNSGTAKVRKYGISLATGEYVIHCDSDDWPEKNMYEMMYARAAEGDCDLVISSYYYHVEDKTYDWGQNFNDEDKVSALLNNTLSSALWNKMVRNSIHDDTFVYSNDNMCEDYLYTVQYLLRSRTIYCLPDKLYHFYYNPVSLSHEMKKTIFVEKHYQIVRNISMAIEMIRTKFGNRYEPQIIRQCLFVKNGLKPYLHHKDVFKIWASTFREVNRKVIFCPSIPYKEKVIFYIIRFHLYKAYKRISK